jgi:aspartate/methionine/tyrosine aminotransferase
MRKSLLPEAGENKFQKIKRKSAVAEAAGIKLTKLSIGQPSGPALVEARCAAAQAVLSDDESKHEYQDNGSPGVKDFAKRFVNYHVGIDLNREGISFLPLPGVKPALDMVIKSLGSWVKDVRVATVGTMTNPGYPTPADMCAMIEGISHFHLKLKPEKGFLFDLDDLGSLGELGEGDLLMLNFPHNPTGIIAEIDWLRGVCAYCEKRGIRVFNDAAYARLAHNGLSQTLTDVAVEFPDLNWAEAFSASKLGNNTGWRVGAIVGSSEFVGDIARIKGNMDSGFVAPMAAGIIHLLENHNDQVEKVREMYAERLDCLQQILTECGMELAVEPQAGFFILCNSPRVAFGQGIADAEAFNDLMISKTGVVGVPFGSYIRYAVCTTDIAALRDEITAAFSRAKVAY